MIQKASFSRRYCFCASHRLHVDAFSDAENRDTFGKCNNPHGHGHNYTLQVTVTGAVHPQTGMVVDLVALDALVKERVIERFDLRNLNLDPHFAAEVSSTENLCRVTWQLLTSAADQHRYGSAHLSRVRIEETSNNFFEYSGEPAERAGQHA